MKVNCNNNTRYEDSYFYFINNRIVSSNKMQKEIISESNTQNRCLMCDTALFSALFNTIPVALYTCSGDPVTARLGVLGDETSYFRIEAIRCHKYATLMLLEATTLDGVTTLTGTEFTITINLDCIGRIQCFAPINVITCTSSTALE